MDATLNALAHKLRFEMLAEEARNQASEPEWDVTLQSRLGDLLVAVGQKLQASSPHAQAVSNEGVYATLGCDTCV